MNKRSDIQGLRALAVLLVVAYHIWPTAIPGGYIGVDVFFVISGFLITAHLLREAERTGTVSVLHFWARRIRRLLPAAFAVLAATVVMVILWVPRSVWEQTFTEIIASAFYVQNWVLATNSVDYLAADANVPSIVQHFWSLSVEEQFYIVWPLIIVGVLFFTKARKWIGVALASVFVLSLVYSIVATAVSPAMAYFVTPTRAWEFAAGGLLAFLPMVLSARARMLVAWAGVAAIAGAAFAYTDATPFPGYTALLPVLGTAAVIWADAPRGLGSPTSLARLAPIQWVGDVSYSLYLWHWPIVVVYPLLRGAEAGIKGGALILAVSVALAWLTKVAVEDPFRRGSFFAARWRRTFAFAATGMVGVLALSGMNLVVLRQQQEAVYAAAARDAACQGAAAMDPANDCDDPFAVPDGYDTAVGKGDRGLLGADCLGVSPQTEVIDCRRGAESGDIRVAVVGNSHAVALATGLHRYGEEQGWEVQGYFRQKCTGQATERVNGVPSSSCVEWTKNAYDSMLSDPDLDAVIFQSYVFGAGEDSDEISVEQSRESWQTFLDAGIAVIVVNDVPGTRPTQTPTCIEEHRDEYDPCAIPRDRLTLSNAMWEAAKVYPGVTAVDLTDYFCDAEKCHSMIGGVMVYFDDHHLTGLFSASLAPYVAGPVLVAVLDQESEKL
ncbi:acyltransferase family protein [Microbacterium marinilacus]|uniref:Acyltransferase family protein n=1 Tax=Microbacterium marinilacus TaxID=415209 RepID=A0ABP7BH76_9MICO|nr:acyltransferase family protein [Microbacterium marinilacus]MBY0688471.1 acyltransferase [Microbacterium marinilacus]